jgi:hypothetical protein
MYHGNMDYILMLMYLNWMYQLDIGYMWFAEVDLDMYLMDKHYILEHLLHYYMYQHYNLNILIELQLNYIDLLDNLDMSMYQVDLDIDLMDNLDKQYYH